MTQLQKVQVAIESLSREDYADLRRWFSDRDWRLWDREVEEDSAAGRLDFLIAEARDEKSKGRLREL